MSGPSFRFPIIDDDGIPTREFASWLQDLRDKPLGHIIETDDATPPTMKKHGTIVWHSVSLDKTYIVHFDGISRYYWEADGVDLY